MAKKLYRKFNAAVILLLLLLTNAVQITHSHTAVKKTTAVLEKSNSSGDCITTPGNDTNCFICDYRLTKDADSFFATAVLPAVDNFDSVGDVYIFPAPLQVLTRFETRGPPASFSAA